MAKAKEDTVSNGKRKKSVKGDGVKKKGRPNGYTESLGDRICQEISTSSKSMKTICEELDLKVSTVLCWLSEGHRNYNPDFAKLYARAKEMQADFMAEEMIEIADDGTNDYMTIIKGDEMYNVEDKEVTNRSKLRVETRKWIASKLKPKKYGDKTDITSDGKPIGGGYNYSNLSDEQILSMIELKKAASGQ